jgi:hypothetical protein
VAFEAELRLSSDSRLVPLFGSEIVFEEAHISQVTRGFSTIGIQASTTNRDFVDNLLHEAAAKGSPQLRYRYGIGGSGGNVLWNTWQETIVRMNTSKILGLGEGAGYSVWLECSDLLWCQVTTTRVKSRKGKISDIVQSIADFYGIPAVIEPTTYEGLWIQSYETDCDFIIDRLLPRAVNDKGRGNYRFFMKDNVLHFHTIDYAADVKQFSYFSSSGEQLLIGNFVVEKLDLGTGGVRYVTHDPYSGIVKEHLSEPGNTLRLGNTAPDFTNTPGIEKNRMYNVGANRIAEVLAMTNSDYEKAKILGYSLELTIPKSTFFYAGDIVNFTISPSPSQITPSSGLYYVPEVNSVIKKQAITSTVILTRGECTLPQNDQSPLAKLGQNVVTPENSAEGQQINLATTASSATTRGAGKEASRRIFLDARNPNNAS